MLPSSVLYYAINYGLARTKALYADESPDSFSFLDGVQRNYNEFCGGEIQRPADAAPSELSGNPQEQDMDVPHHHLHGCSLVRWLWLPGLVMQLRR